MFMIQVSIFMVWAQMLKPFMMQISHFHIFQPFTTGKFQILHLNSNRVGYSSDIKIFLAPILYIDSTTLKVLLP
jgi:hypothetical protein